MKTDGYGTGKTRNNCHPMKKYVLPLVVYLAALAAISAQEYRSIDGSGNNPFYPSWGAQNTTLTNYVLSTMPMGLLSRMEQIVQTQEGLVTSSSIRTTLSMTLRD